MILSLVVKPTIADVTGCMTGEYLFSTLPPAATACNGPVQVTCVITISSLLNEQKNMDSYDWIQYYNILFSYANCREASDTILLGDALEGKKLFCRWGLTHHITLLTSI